GERPIAGWSVVAGPIRADASSGFMTDAVTTDADGHFRIEHCPAGPICVYARDPAKDDVRGVPLDRVANARLRVDLSAGGEKEITLPIPSADAAEYPTVELDLVVTSADDGRPIPGVEVLAWGTIGEVEYGLLSRSLPTDAEG